MFSGVTSSARSPSHTKMMTLRGADPPCCGVAGPPPSARTTNDKTIRTMNLFAFTRMAEAQLRWSSLNDLIRPQQHRPRDRQPERPGGLQVDDELELRGLLPWKIIGLGALQNLVRAPLASSFPSASLCLPRRGDRRQARRRPPPRQAGTGRWRRPSP